MKTDDEGSRVLHVRGLPDDVSEHEIWKLVLPFKTLGLMVNFMHLKVGLFSWTYLESLL